MPASPFTLTTSVRTTHDGIVQHGWQVVQLVPGRSDPEPLHEPWYGVFSKQLAAAFLDGVLLMWFAQQRLRPPKPRPPKTADQRIQEFQFS